MTPTPTVHFNDRLRILSFLSLLLLISLIIFWEVWYAPIRPGGSFLVLKAIPLLFPLKGIWRGNIYTMQWASMLILLYVLEGSMRLMSDLSFPSRLMAGAELLIACIFFFSSIFYVSPAKKAYKSQKKKKPHEQ